MRFLSSSNWHRNAGRAVGVLATIFSATTISIFVLPFIFAWIIWKNKNAPDSVTHQRHQRLTLDSISYRNLNDRTYNQLERDLDTKESKLKVGRETTKALFGTTAQKQGAVAGLVVFLSALLSAALFPGILEYEWFANLEALLAKWPLVGLAHTPSLTVTLIFRV